MHYILINLNICNFFQRKINFSHVHEISCWWRAIGRRKTINKFKNWLYWYCWITLVCLDRCLKVKECDYSVPIIFHNDCCLHKLNIFKSFACSRNVMHKCSWTATPLFAACLYIYYLILLSYVTLRKALQPRSEFCSQNLLCNLHLQSTHKIYCRQ